MGRRPVAATTILKALVERPNDERYGLDLIAETGLRSGSLYPALAKLEERGWVSSRWEQRGPAELGRPRRRLYKLTPNGIAEAVSVEPDRAAWNSIPQLAPGTAT